MRYEHVPTRICEARDRLWFAAVYEDSGKGPGARPQFIVKESRDHGDSWRRVSMRRCVLSSIEAWIFAQWPPCEFLAIGFDEQRGKLWIELENDIAVDGRGIVWRATRAIDVDRACWRIVRTEKDSPMSQDRPLRF